jgi:chemotaxis protein methyltransferase CheR
MELQAKEFERARRMIHRAAGLNVSPAKRAMVANRLSRCLKASGHGSFGAYLDSVEAEGSPERERFINALTTNLTSFFREPHHFPILVQHLRRHARTNRSRYGAPLAPRAKSPTPS